MTIYDVSIGETMTIFLKLSSLCFSLRGLTGYISTYCPLTVVGHALTAQHHSSLHRETFVVASVKRIHRHSRIDSKKAIIVIQF